MVGVKRQESARDIINIFTDTCNIDYHFDPNLLYQVEHMFENSYGQSDCSSNLMAMETGSSTKNTPECLS